MNKSLALVSGIVMMSLAGCSSQLEKQTASGSYDYLDAKQSKPVETPDDLDKPNFTRDYALPEMGPGANDKLVGRNVPVTSPALVHPLVTGSHVEEGSRDAAVVFDQVDDRQPLSEAIWSTLQSYLKKEDVQIASFDKQNGKLVTDWFTLTREMEDEDSPWYALSDEVEAERKRKFAFTLNVKPHGRTAELKAELLDFQETVGSQVKDSVNELEKRREEVAVLNHVIAHYEYQIQLDNTRRMAQIRRGLNTEMGFNSKDDSAIIVDGKYDVVWPRMLLVLRKLGFDVKDLDKSTGLLFVTYNGTDDGWWGSLFSGDDEILEQGDYRLKVEPRQERTVVTFMNDESQAFSPKEVTDIFEPFSSVMSQDDLDI